jgi:hypothetical protein
MGGNHGVWMRSQCWMTSMLSPIHTICHHASQMFLLVEIIVRILIRFAGLLKVLVVHITQ